MSRRKTGGCTHALSAAYSDRSNRSAVGPHRLHQWKKNSSIDTIAISKSTSLFFFVISATWLANIFHASNALERYYTGTVLSVLTADNTTQNTRKRSGSFGGSREPAM